MKDGCEDNYAVKWYENILSDELKSLRFLWELKMIKYLKHPCLSLPIKIFPAESKEFTEAYIAFNKAEIDLE